MRIAVVGGKLQGVEIVYLAKKAGFETVLIDRYKNTPASAICNTFVQFEFKEEDIRPSDCGKIDIIFPAIEDLQSLHLIKCWADHLSKPIVLDISSYTLSSSKRQSNALFKELQLPLPAERGFPAVVKPDCASGSTGVTVVSNETELKAALMNRTGDVVVQEYLEGPSYSIEVIGTQGHYKALQVTELFMDADYDCRGVAAPARLANHFVEELCRQARLIASRIELSGIMDLEVILHEGALKILEIDARFPSQTPIAVYFSTGVNMVEMLVDLFTRTGMVHRSNGLKHAMIEHISVSASGMVSSGEHIMAQHGPLRHLKNFFGADEALTSYDESVEFEKFQGTWVATLIFTGASRTEIEKKRSQAYKNISEKMGFHPDP